MKPITTKVIVPAVAAAAVAGAAFAQVPSMPPGNPPMPPIANSLTTIDGVVREIFGNKFIVEAAAGGRQLIETGPRGRDLVRVAVGDRVRVEGQARDGFVHADAVTLANGQRLTLEGPGPGRGPGPLEGPDAAFNQNTVLDAVKNAGYRDARIQDVKKRHAEVVATGTDGRQWELHVEFDGNIRKTESLSVLSEPEIKTLIERAGYTYAGSMRPEKKHMVVLANNSRGERVEIDVHRDGSIKKEKRVF